MRKITAAILSAILLLVCCAGLVSCSSNPTEGAATIGYAFVQDIVDRKYADAYNYVYSFTADVKTADDFVLRYNNIYDALEISDVTLLNRDVTKKEDSENEYLLSYTLQMQSGILGTLTYNYNADIVSSPLGYKVIYLPSLILPTMEEGDKVRVMNQGGVRGEIFAADGKLLAKNDFAQSIYIDLDKEPDFNTVKQLLASMFDVDMEKAQKKYDNAVEKGYPLEVLLTFPRDTITAAQKEQIEAVNGLGVDDERLSPIRYYPMADSAAHLVGYMGAPTEKQVEKYKEEGVQYGDTVGQAGIEGSMEETLRGTDGRIIYIENEKGEIKEVLYEDAKTDGADITLTIDTDLQNTAYTLLASNCAADMSGAAVVMDYTNGDVKAMASYPSFDDNLFNFPMDQKVWEYYQDPENLTPLFSRTTQALYMPGSTFKPFSSVPAIREGKLAEDTDPGLNIQKDEKNRDYWVPNIPGITWNYPAIWRVSTPDQFNFEYCMKSSDNIFFAYFALIAEQNNGDFLHYMKEIGMGEAPNFEIPLTPSKKVEQDDEINWRMVAEAGYGTGKVAMTPIQLASLYTALMNDGDILNPTVVEKVSKTVDNEETVEWENERTVFKSGVMPQKAIDMSRQAMRRVIEDGTAYEAWLQDVDGLIAKTGTAQYNTPDGGKREYNWVIALNPNNNLLYLVVLDTVLDEGTPFKLAILNGLVKPENYDSALRTNIPEPTYSDPDTGDTQDTQDGPDTTQDDTDPQPDPDPEPDQQPDSQPDDAGDNAEG